MLKSAPFLQKLLGRLERLDRRTLETQLAGVLEDLETVRTLLDDLQEGVIVASEEGSVLLANTPALDWLGIPASALSGKARLHEIIKDREMSRFIQSRFSSLKERVAGQLQILTPREMRLRVLMSRLRDGKILILLVQASAEQRMEGDTIAKIEALARLAAGVAHEIGNPLNSISIHLQLLRQEIKKMPDPQKKNLEKTVQVLRDETARMDKIIKNFLKAARKPPLRFRLENVNDIVSEVLEFMAPDLREKKITAHWKPDPDLPEFLVDRLRLHQAFINLVKNAAEAMPGGGKLYITSEKKLKTAVFEFRDTGKGIAEADLPHIFEAYYTTKEDGSGLGLMTVFNAVQEHGGRIEVVSRIGKGTTFTLLLPVRLPKLQLPHQK